MQMMKKMASLDCEALDVIKYVAKECPVDKDPAFWEKVKDQLRNAALNAAVEMIEKLTEENERLEEVIEEILASNGAYSDATEECGISH